MKTFSISQMRVFVDVCFEVSAGWGEGRAHRMIMENNLRNSNFVLHNSCQVNFQSQVFIQQKPEQKGKCAQRFEQKCTVETLIV